MRTSVALALSLLLVACGQGSHRSITEPAGPVATPTPAPSNIAGTWLGSSTTDDPTDCYEGQPADATLQQAGAAVTGTLHDHSSCAPHTMSVQGTWDGRVLSGTWSGHYDNGQLQSGTLMGGFSAQTLRVTLSFPPANNLFRLTMQLHR